MLDLFYFPVVTIDSLTDSVARVLLQASKPAFVYKAGQYVALHHQHQAIPFSIACAPNQKKLLEFHIYHPMHNLQANGLLEQARMEKRWQLSGPWGVCTADKFTSNESIIFIAYGTGFAPIKALLEELFTLPQLPPIHLYWAMPQEKNFYFLSLLHEWQTLHASFTFTAIVLADKKDWHPLVVDEYVLRDFPDLSQHQVYIAAPKAFVLAALRLFTQKGLRREKLFSDLLV